MQAKKKFRLIPLLSLMLIISMSLFITPVIASAEEPLDDEENYDEYYDEYAQWWADEELVELPDEYYPNYEPVFQDGENPFAPDGTGTVIGNATDDDGKEFYTIETPDGNVFYLIIDRQRSVDNVYFLGAVTEEDLMSLAQPGNGKSVPETDDVPMPLTENDTENKTEKTTSPVTPSDQEAGDDLMLYVILGVAVLGISGAAYYFKIAKPKREGTDYSDDYGEDYEDEDDDNGEDEYDDDEEDPGEEESEEGFRNTDNSYDNTAADTSDGSYDTQQNRQRTSEPSGQPQGNRSSRRRRRKRRKPNYSG